MKYKIAVLFFLVFAGFSHAADEPKPCTQETRVVINGDTVPCTNLVAPPHEDKKTLATLKDVYSLNQTSLAVAKILTDNNVLDANLPKLFLDMKTQADRLCKQYHCDPAEKPSWIHRLLPRRTKQRASLGGALFN